MTKLMQSGIEQMGTPWADGVPGITQRPIQPGQSYTYKWQATNYGSYFYHAHARGQIDDGFYGPIIIRPKANAQKPFAKIAAADVALLEAAERKSTPLILSDWRHQTSDRAWQLELASGLESASCMDSLLLNGKGAVDCWSRDEINKLTSPNLAPLLAQFNLQMTNKGYAFPSKARPLLT
jgi:FtsP/CotA-like multicopper oxidase with cupredoxin domain